MPLIPMDLILTDDVVLIKEDGDMASLGLNFQARGADLEAWALAFCLRVSLEKCEVMVSVLFEISITSFKRCRPINILKPVSQPGPRHMKACQSLSSLNTWRSP